MNRTDSHPSTDDKFRNRPWVLVVESIAFAVLAVWAGTTGRAPWWALAVGTVGFGVAVAYMRDLRPFGRHTLLILVAWVLLLSLVACAPGPIYTDKPGPGIPPEVVGIRFVHEGEDMECGIGLTRDAVAAVVTAFAPPVGFVAWLAWTVTDGEPVTNDLKQCWDTSQANWREFEAVVQCWGMPTYTTTWTDPGAYQAWVKMPFCQCNLTCQRESMLTAAGWRYVQNWCRQTLNWFFCFGIGPNTATQMTETPPPENQPLPPGFAPPGWDTAAPVPVHPQNCEQPDCSDLLGN